MIRLFGFFSGSQIFKDIRRIMAYSLRVLQRHRSFLYRASFLKGLSFFLGLSIVYLTKIALDKGIFGKDLAVFLGLTFLSILAFVVVRSFQYLSNKLVSKARKSFSVDVNRDLMRRFFGLDYLRIKQLSSAENAFFLNYDYSVIESIVFDHVPSLFSVLKIPILFLLSFFLCWQLAVSVLVVFPIIVLHTGWTSRKMERYRSRSVNLSRKHHSVINDVLRNIKIIKSFFKEEWALDRIMARFRRKQEGELEFSLFSQRTRFAADILTKFVTAAFWLYGGYLIITDRLTFGSFSAVSMYTAMIVSELYGLGFVLQQMYGERSAIRRNALFIGEIGGASGESQLSASPDGAAFFGGDIKFENVVFGYDKGKAVIEGVSFAVPSGKWTLVQGVSGAGKTTLLSLLMLLFPPWKGNMFFCGESIGDIDRALFSRWISVVHQEPYLFNDTVIGNVLLGERLEGDDLDAVLKCARLDELAKQLSRGYNSLVGESGTLLSGGQRQRIAIARALARKPRILVLDEATSFIDPDMEAEILGSIKDLYPELTVLFVTHRMSAVKFADEIFVLDKGRIFKRTICV